MSAWELAHWQALYERDPWDEARADYRAGIVASTLANLHGNSTKPSDFVPQYGPAPEQTEDAMRLALLKFTRGMGGDVK